MRKKFLLIPISILLISALIAGLYAANMFGYLNEGNSSRYSVENTKSIDSPLEGKKIIFLGSSVTYGFASKGESFVNYMVKRDGITAVKEAKSGTTLVDDSSDSYISRMKRIDTKTEADMFICQLSTNDATKGKELGSVIDSFNIDDFDTHTVAGAIEYIISYAQSVWDCPVVFYTSPKYDSENYEGMVKLLSEIKAKWNIAVIDLWNNKEISSLADKKDIMNDNIHPTRKGYRDYWTPVFEEFLVTYFQDKQL